MIVEKYSWLKSVVNVFPEVEHLAENSKDELQFFQYLSQFLLIENIQLSKKIQKQVFHLPNMKEAAA